MHNIACIYLKTLWKASLFLSLKLVYLLYLDKRVPQVGFIFDRTCTVYENKVKKPKSRCLP